MNTFSHVPPGFRFHPTDEELVDYYLRKKIASQEIDLGVIKDVDLHRVEPWDLEDKCRIGAQEEKEWYFFNHKDKKYPTGTRTNRATALGFWKATGRDKPVYSRQRLVGMRKTLVFYQGRAPNGRKSDWIMHEYRLETMENAPSSFTQEEGWVVCRVFKKRAAPARASGELYFAADFDSPATISEQQTSFRLFHDEPYTCKRELGFQDRLLGENFVHLPRLESPLGSSSRADEEQITDWRVFEKLVASQLSPECAPEEDPYPGAAMAVDAEGKRDHQAL